MNKQMILITALCFAHAISAMENPAQQLVVAARSGDLEKVANLLDQGTNPNQDICWEGTPLLAAINSNHIQVVDLLLSRRANPSLALHARNMHPFSEHGVTPLIKCAELGNVQIAQLLLRGGVSPHETHQAYGANPHECTPHECGCVTALHVAAGRGHAALVELLLRKGASPGVMNSFSMTPLTSAARTGQQENICLLLSVFSEADEQQMRDTCLSFLLCINRLRVHEDGGWNVVCPEQSNDSETKPDQRLKQARKFVTACLIHNLIEERMQRAESLVSLCDWENQQALDVAIKNHHQEVAQLLDLKNPISCERIRTRIASNIKRILFKKP